MLSSRVVAAEQTMMDAASVREAAKFASKHVPIDTMQPLSCLEIQLVVVSTRFEFVEFINRRPLGSIRDATSHSHALMGHGDQLDSTDSNLD
jgi:hypothetical protein